MNEAIQAQPVQTLPTFATRGELIAALEKADEIVKVAACHFYLENDAQCKANHKTKWLWITGIFGTLTLTCGLGIVLWGIFALIYTRRKKDLTTAAEENAAANEVLKSHSEEIGFLPVKYYVPRATSYMLEAMQCGRADSLKEAMLQTEAQMHNWNMEDSQQQILRETKEANSQLRVIAWNTLFR